MKTNKYKIVVLSDLKDTIQTILKSTVSLAKMIDGEIEVFSVLKPTEMVEKENQLSAMRSINSVQTKSNSALRKTIAPLAQEYGVPINYSFAVGNVKNEIARYFEKHKPNIVVLGKRKTKPYQLLGDGITSYVLNRYSGTIMITNHKNVLEPNNALSLGILNGSGSLMNKPLTSELMAFSDKPLKNFKFIKDSNMTDTTQTLSDKRTVDYVFNHSDNALNNLTNYVAKNKINLLFIDREKGFDAQKSNSIHSDIKGIIGKLDTNLMFTSVSEATFGNSILKDKKELNKSIL
ncbi:MAG: universal stress protein [Maribacter sp.]|uniref:universal stress protein n=1 Tax=Maribacter sp. TaxID=1897614 RepID=UPI003C75026A